MVVQISLLILITISVEILYVVNKLVTFYKGWFKFLICLLPLYYEVNRTQR